MLVRVFNLVILHVSAFSEITSMQADDTTAMSAVQAPLCAIGDLHGDEKHALRALRLCSAVDEQGSWIGGAMTVVQVGDVLDRGNRSLPLLERLWAIRQEAAEAGGELVLLLGNHELLNLQGRLKYVDQGELHAYGGVTHWRSSFDPRSGYFGVRLASQDGFAIRGSAGCRTMFVHAGLRASLAQQYMSLEALNTALRAQLVQNRGDLLDPYEGPLWYRGYARPKLGEDVACAELSTMLATIGDGAVRMVVGHNVREVWL